MATHSSCICYSCLENSMDRGACWVTVHGITELDRTEWTNTFTSQLACVTHWNKGRPARKLTKSRNKTTKEGLANQESYTQQKELCFKNEDEIYSNINKSYNKHSLNESTTAKGNVKQGDINALLYPEACWI